MLFSSGITIKVTSIRTICNAMKCDSYRSMLSEVHKQLWLYLTVLITSSTSESAFSTTRHLLTYLRATMTEQRLNNCTLLHIHKDITDNLDVKQQKSLSWQKKKEADILTILFNIRLFIFCAFYQLYNIMHNKCMHVQ